MQVHRGMDALTVYYSGSETGVLDYIYTLPGITIDYISAGNGPGTGRMRYRDGLLYWKAPGSTAWGAPEIAVDGKQCLLQDGYKYVRVTIDTDYVREGSEAVIHIEDVYENDITPDDVTAGEATSGDILDYNVTLNNNSGNVISELKCWISGNCTWLEISDDDITYVSPATEADALSLADISGGSSATLYLRRTIAAAAASNANLLNQLYFSFVTV